MSKTNASLPPRGIILLDGADACGKTTLAGAIAKRAAKLGATPVIRHLGKPDPGTCWEEHRTAILNYVSEAFSENKLVIADRHFLSESIYGCVYRTGSEYPFGARHVDRLLHRFRALRVICAPPVDIVVESHAKMKAVRFEEYDSGMDKVAQRYLDLWNGATSASTKSGPWDYRWRDDYIQSLTISGGVADRLGWYHYDFNTQGRGSDVDTYARYLLQELASEQDLIPQQLLDVNEWHFTGFPSKSSVLLVGDRISDDNGIKIPFFANSGSSDYLVRTLHGIGADEARVVIVNINDPGGEETTRELAKMCGRTIVMGREAEKTMLKCGIHYDTQIRHPQHARRFTFHDDRYYYEMKMAFNGMAGADNV